MDDWWGKEKTTKQTEKTLCFNWVFLQRCMCVWSPAGVWDT